MRITGIDHVQLAMPPGGEPAARTFYGALLGLREVAKPEPLASRGGCWFEGPGTILHLGVQPDFVPARKAHAALLVADLDACREVLVAAGVDTSDDAALPDTPRLYAHDPFGNRLEFIQQGFGFSERAPAEA